MTLSAEFYQYTDYLTREIEYQVAHSPNLRPYWARVSTRLIVSNNLEAHLKPDAPKDVAVYYYAPGALDEELPMWRLVVIETWLRAIDSGFDKQCVAGLRRGLLNTRLPLRLLPTCAAERDNNMDDGYNIIRNIPGMGIALWGDRIWRNGECTYMPAPFNPETAYKHTATPLALLE